MANESYIETVIPHALPWQQPLIDKLVTLQRNHKLPHAIVIDIQSSVDSRQFIWQLVTALLCNAEKEEKPCGQCQACHLMQANNYPDFTFISLELNDKTQKLNKDIKVEQIRRLIHRMSLTDSLSAGKFAVIYPAEKMNLAAANSLLKTLEEPSAGATLILLTHHIGRLPVTIRSRCQQWNLYNPDHKQASDWLSSQSMDPALIDDYLKLTHGDAQFAATLHQQDFIQQQHDFSKQLDGYVNDQLSAAALAASMKSRDLNTLRLLLQNKLAELIKTCLQTALSRGDKLRLCALLNLQKHAQHVLKVEENNLNLQLQLEDVLISMKQIIKRG